MKRVLLATALVLAQIAPAAAFNLGCWDTTSISQNTGEPAGSYVNSQSSVDYIEPANEGVGLLFQSLPDYSSASYIICFAGASTAYEGAESWQVSAAIICPSSDLVGGVCPD